MAEVKRGVYVGNSYRKLRGKTALVRPAPGGGDHAQFDDANDPDSRRYAYGWHWFAPDSFKIQKDSDD